MKVVIRVDASLEIGSGHVMRCLTLAEALRKESASVLFLCKSHKGNLINYIEGRGFEVIKLSPPDIDSAVGNLFHSSWLGASQGHDALESVEHVANRAPDLLVVDHYALDNTWENILRPYCDHLMVIDDLGDRYHECDILLDQNYGSSVEKYRNLVPSDCKILVGAGYAMLRPEFAKLRSLSLSRRKNPSLHNILISLGGVDAKNITTEILNRLSYLELSHAISITVVMGSAAPHLREVQETAAVCGHVVNVVTNVDNMAELMANSDMAIGAAGSTTWERCCLGLPTIQCVLAENQKKVANELLRKNAVLPFSWEGGRIDEFLVMLEGNASLLATVSNNCSTICDGLGMSRLLSILKGRCYG